MITTSKESFSRVVNNPADAADAPVQAGDLESGNPNPSYN